MVSNEGEEKREGVNLPPHPASLQEIVNLLHCLVPSEQRQVPYAVRLIPCGGIALILDHFRDMFWKDLGTIMAVCVSEYVDDCRILTRACGLRSWSDVPFLPTKFFI